MKDEKNMKSQNPSRPWENEPDRLEFKYRGFDCLIRRAGPKSQNSHDWLGHLCGYVAVTPNHPYYGKSYNDDEIDLHAHGGLTYSDFCHGDICHKTENEDKAWWFGFDCAHFGDLVPSIAEAREPGGYLYEINQAFASDSIFRKADILREYEIYKTIGFVKNEIRNLVKQLEKVA